MVKDPNLFVEFQTNSHDFLKVLGEMSAKADQGRPVMTQTKDYQEQVATMELFWDITEKIFLKYEERILTLRMLLATEHAKALILRNELRDTYNEMFKVRDKIPETVLRVMTKTALPSKADFSEEVVLKNKQSKDGQKD